MNDIIVEPVRSKLIKGFNHIKQKSVELGAIGCSISGSGPTMFALCDDESVANNIIDFSNSFYNKINIGCDTYLSRVNNNGPSII